MGSILSAMTQENFAAGKYWIGTSVGNTQKALQMHFRDAHIVPISTNDLYNLEDKRHHYDRIVIVYDPVDYTTVNVIKG